MYVAGWLTYTSAHSQRDMKVATKQSSYYQIILHKLSWSDGKLPELRREFGETPGRRIALWMLTL